MRVLEHPILGEAQPAKMIQIEVDGQLSVIRFENGESPEGRPGGDAGG